LIDDRMLCAAGLITAALASGAFAQQQEEKLGTLSFPTSCDPKVQAEFERRLAIELARYASRHGSLIDRLTR